MQNLSLLQLLKTLSAVNPPAPQRQTESPQNEPSPTTTAEKTVDFSEEKQPFPPTHAQNKAEKSVAAYESFLSRHEQAVRRVENRKEP